MKLGNKVKIIDGLAKGNTGKIIEKVGNGYKIELDEEIEGCKYYVALGGEFKEIFEEIEKNVTTHHVTITTEKLKELIKNNYKWNDYNLQGKIDIVTHLVYFENDRELLEFLLYMEGKENV